MAETTEILPTLPLDSWHRAHGARMVAFAGYAMPVQYEGVIAEHNWTRTNAGLFDVSHMGQLTFHGDRVDAALETLLPGELQLLKDGRLRYSMLLDEEGGIIDDLMATGAATISMSSSMAPPSMVISSSSSAAFQKASSSIT